MIKRLVTIGLDSGLVDHVQSLRQRASKERTSAERCRDPAVRNRHLAIAMIVDELADYMSDPSRHPASFWHRLERSQAKSRPHLRLVSSR
jgi:hypothetical protein